MSARRSRRVLPLMIATVLIASSASVPLAGRTDATWVDQENSSAQFSAIELETPEIISCTIEEVLILGFQSVTIRWISEQDLNRIRLTIDDEPIGRGSISQSGPGPYAYEATLSEGLLQNLLGNLLGNSYEIAVEEVLPDSEWTSPPATGTLKIGPLGGGLGSNSCTVP